jgi:hypothetical protein
MAMNQNFGMMDTLELKVFRDGKLIAERETSPRMLTLRVPTLKNVYVKFLKVLGLGDKYAGDLVVNAGIKDVAQMIYDQYDYVGIGTSAANPVDPTQTALGAQVETRVAPAKSIIMTTIADDTAQFSGQFTLTAPRVLKESGLFVLATGGVMLARQVFSDINLNSGDIVTFVWKIQVARV